MKIKVEKKKEQKKINSKAEKIIEVEKEINKLTSKIKEISSKIDKLEKSKDKELDKLYNITLNTYGKGNDILTDKFLVVFNKGLSTIIPNTINTKLLPKQFVVVKYEPNKLAIKSAYLQNGRRMPKSLSKFKIKCQDTLTINVSEL